MLRRLALFLLTTSIACVALDPSPTQAQSSASTSALAAAQADPAPPALPDFHFVTNRASTADLIRESSAHVAPPPARADMDYLPFFPAET